METKKCGTCLVIKPVEQFARKRGSYSSKCKECHNAYYKNYWKNTEVYEKHKARVNANRPHKAIKYGLTEIQFNKLMAKYDGFCWICQVRPATCIDHDHDTKRIRGVLCSPCNTGLGKLGDTLEGLQKAVDYLSLVSAHAYNM